VALGALSLFPLAGSAVAEPTFVPKADDIVGAGSDTTQFAMDNLIDGASINGFTVPGYNADRTSARLVSFDTVDASGALIGGNIVPKEGATAVPRPNGSGDGKSRLFGAGNDANINYARSSSSLSSAEAGANLYQIPFAVDGLKMAVDGTQTNAPAGVSVGDLVKIYNGDYTNWSQLPGSTTSGTIDALIPQAGSGTRSFFLGLLKAANNGVDVSLAGVKETQEHSDKDIKADPNAIAPFSTGRAKSTPTIKLLAGSADGGFDAKRALYNVVRQSDLTASWFEPIFGETGFICSTAAKPLIEKAGFDQLATPADGGACGAPTQSAVQNFTTNQHNPTQNTATTLMAAVKAQNVTLTATVKAPAGTPEGSVAFFEGAKQVGTANLSGGVGIATLTRVAPGTHTYKASYTPADAAAFVGSDSGTKTARVAKLASKTTVTMVSKFGATKRVPATVKVLAGGRAAAGKVVVKDGLKQIASGLLKSGKVSILLPRLKAGSHKLHFNYVGNATTKGSSVTKGVTVTK
jgi:ABC-type phosphate transport system substrate-binding protein